MRMSKMKETNPATHHGHILRACKWCQLLVKCHKTKINKTWSLSLRGAKNSDKIHTSRIRMNMMKVITKLSSKFWRNVEKEQTTIQRVQKGHKGDDIWSSGVQSNSAGQRGGKGISNKRSPLQSTEVCAWGMV